MRMIIKPMRKYPRYPKHKIKHCSFCGAWLYAAFEDCYQSETVFGVPAFYIDCPHCGRSIHYRHV